MEVCNVVVGLSVQDMYALCSAILPSTAGAHHRELLLVGLSIAQLYARRGVHNGIYWSVSPSACCIRMCCCRGMATSLMIGNHGLDDNPVRLAHAFPRACIASFLATICIIVPMCFPLLAAAILLAL